MSNKEKILEMLKDNELTVKEIAKELDLKEKAVHVYICRLRKDKLIEKVGKKNRYNIYTAIQKEKNIESLLDTKILEKMIPKFIEYGISLETTTDIEDKRIMELIKECQ